VDAGLEPRPGLYDRDTGLVRFAARDYDPSVGRWTAKDPIGFEGGLNFYECAGNDSVNFIDPSGLSWKRQGPRVPGAMVAGANWEAWPHRTLGEPNGK
jgi:RHS repeat-associated protein